MRYMEAVTVESLIEPVQQVLAYRQEDSAVTPEALIGVKNILENWQSNKQKIRSGDMFLGHTIVEIKQINAYLDEEHKEMLIGDFINSLINWDEYYPDYPEYYEAGAHLATFFEKNMRGFFENKTTTSYELPNGMLITENSKISKSIKYFIDDKFLLRYIQDKYSEIIQQDKISGTLCASIHPLDFLSSSENNYGWRSCHALNGEFASGNVSYMMDNCTIMFYLKGADDVKLPRFPSTVPWNDKKWRMLVFKDPWGRFVFAGRQYPFFNQELLDAVGDFIRTYGHFQSNTGWINRYVSDITIKYDNENMEEPTEVPVNLHHEYILTRHFDLVMRHQIINDAKHSNHYNDLLKSSCYIPYYMLSHDSRIDVYDLFPMTVGHAAVCACCGKEIYTSSEDFICNDCYEHLHPTICACCGAIIDTDKGEYAQWLCGYGDVCPHCYKLHTTRCEHCNRLISDKQSCHCQDNLIMDDWVSIPIENINDRLVGVDTSSTYTINPTPNYYYTTTQQPSENIEHIQQQLDELHALLERFANRENLATEGEN